VTGRTRAAYDHFAEYYDTDDNPLTLLEHQPVVKAVAPRPHDRLLEAACGTGAYIRDWLDREARVSGFDFYAGVLEIARRKFPGQDLVQASLDERLPYDDESFDVVNCSQALKHTGDLALPLREFCRVIKPAGRIVFSVTHPDMTWDGFAMLGALKFVIGQETDVSTTPSRITAVR
jgi:ubiquinone/menaquinone biosynthesis C-methylase UbiE